MSKVAQRPYQQCTISVMDNINDPDISFDENGVCNYYHQYQIAEKEHVKTGAEGKSILEQKIDEIKKAGKGKQYDCIMGLSGGVDSSYVALVAKEYGLRPLPIHFDNGWNSELAVNNIENIVNKLGLDLYTLVVDWEEFKDVQLAYLKASVVDIEVVSDHAIEAATWKLCLQHGIKYVLSGTNIYTEFVMPRSWIFNKRDHLNLKAIHDKYGTKKLKTYPLNDTMLKKRSDLAGITQVNLLNYVDYDKKAAKERIATELGWRDYGGKHYESLFTKIYQAYILPEKFKIDKRKPHLSSTIFSGQITKEEALDELKKPLYTPEVFKAEKEFFLKKLDLTEADWEQILATPPRSHLDFPIERPLDERYKILKPAKFVYNKLRGIK